MCDDERIEPCSGKCGEEACVCDEICDTCKGWSAQCSCPTEPVLAYWCNDCQEVVEVDIEVVNRLNEQLVFPICSACESEQVIRVDEIEPMPGDER